MKIKFDFVTNSSSTSFIGFGASFDVSEIKKILNDISLMLPGHFDNFDYDNMMRLHDQLDEVLEAVDLTYIYNSTSSIYYIGEEISIANMDETLRQMQERVDKKFEKLKVNKSSTLILEMWEDY